MELADGCLWEKHLSHAAVFEHASLYEETDNSYRSPSLTLSIRAGELLESCILTRRRVLAGRFYKITKTKRLQRDGESQHQTMRMVATYGYRWYKRFNVNVGLGNIKLDTWEEGYMEPSGDRMAKRPQPGGNTLTKIKLATEAYISRGKNASLHEYAPPRVMLEHTAEKLVWMRRACETEAMTEGGEKRAKWEAYLGKHLPGEREFFENHIAKWDYAMIGRKETK